METIQHRFKTLFDSKCMRFAERSFVSVMLISVFGGATFAKYSVVIDDEGTKTVALTSCSEPEDILKQESITLSAHDKYIFSGFENNRATITIERASEIKISADGQEHVVYLTEGTVADALAAASLTVTDDDLMNASLEEPVYDGMQVAINRVTYETVTTQTEIPFDTVEFPTRTLAKGKTRTLSEGQNGVQETQTKRTYIDGVLVEEEVLSETVTVSPVAAHVLVGDPDAPVSQLVPSDEIVLDANGNPVSYKYKVTGKATAYAALGRPTKLKPGHVAMNLSQFPRGTKLYIKTPDGSFVYGYSVVADTGPAVTNGVCLVDLFFSTYTESCLFGAKTVEIYVLS